MNLSHLLNARRAAGKPVRVALIGAGKFGSMFLSQVPHTPGLEVPVIVDLDPERAREACRTVGWDAARIAATDFTDDGAKATSGAIEVIVEATGNPAVGIRHALDVHGLTRVALVDFDVHHGNGSEDILAGDERVLMCSIFETGLYPFNGPDARSLKDAPNMVNVGLPPRSGSDAFRAAVTDHWLPALDAFRPQLIYVSAGFDAHREDDMGNLGLVDADYAWVTRQLMNVAERHCRGRMISCLEGGYVLNPLARSAAAHVKVLIGAD